MSRLYPNAADLAPVALAPLPADFDEMLAAAPALTGSSDLNWLGHEARLNSAKGDGAEEDGSL